MHSHKIILSNFIHKYCPVGTLIRVSHNGNIINPVHHYDANRTGALIDKHCSHKLKGIHELTKDSDTNLEFGSYGNWYVQSVTAMSEPITTIDLIDIDLPILCISIDWRRLKGVN